MLFVVVRDRSAAAEAKRCNARSICTLVVCLLSRCDTVGGQEVKMPLTSIILMMKLVVMLTADHFSALTFYTITEQKMQLRNDNRRGQCDQACRDQDAVQDRAQGRKDGGFAGWHR